MKATAAEAEARTAKVAEWLVEGRSRADICQYARESGWGISDGQVDRYIARARRAIREGHRKDWDMTLAMATVDTQRDNSGPAAGLERRASLAFHGRRRRLAGCRPAVEREAGAAFQPIHGGLTGLILKGACLTCAWPTRGSRAFAASRSTRMACDLAESMI